MPGNNPPDSTHRHHQQNITTSLQTVSKTRPHVYKSQYLTKSAKPRQKTQEEKSTLQKLLLYQIEQ